MQLVECVPNFSEGRRKRVIDDIRDAAAAVAGVTVLDLSADTAHNRMVLTFVGEPVACAEAAFRCAKRASELIDMRRHRGEHPRMGATDVIPFVPISGVSMEDCAALARTVGARLGAELGIPVFLYAQAASRPERVRLPDVRRGEYEGLRSAIETDASRAPDFGPSRMGPAGATAVGARPFLVAYNINLATRDIELARSIAKSVRASSGGFAGVQARGMATPDERVVQVSMNLLDTDTTPLHVVYEAVRDQAAGAGVELAGSEVVGLVPLSALSATFAHFARAGDFSSAQVLEHQLLRSRSQ